ncbi:hypothetical protein [Rhodococcus opacus]|nr:hypothetical protein [Rhodococcus opacus]
MTDDEGVWPYGITSERATTPNIRVTPEMTGLWPPYSFAGSDQATP